MPSMEQREADTIEQRSFRVHGPLRFICGVLLMSLALFMLSFIEGMDWGVAATTIVPACCLALPALSLMKRKVLRLKDQVLEIEVGWIWRRCHEIPLTGAAIEVLPMAGMSAVVLRFSQHAVPVLLWVRAQRADAVCQFLDQVAPDGAWPRVEHERAQWDR